MACIEMSLWEDHRSESSWAIFSLCLRAVDLWLSEPLEVIWDIVTSRGMIPSAQPSTKVNHFGVTCICENVSFHWIMIQWKETFSHIQVTPKWFTFVDGWALGIIPREVTISQITSSGSDNHRSTARKHNENIAQEDSLLWSSHKLISMHAIEWG